LSGLASQNPFLGIPKYPWNEINDIVYPVHGGLEDYAYAGNIDRYSNMMDCGGDPMTMNYPENS
jgi:hypothetical protein